MARLHSSNPADPNQLILVIFPAAALSFIAAVKKYTKNRFLLNNTNDDTVWTNAWNGGNSAVINAALKELFKFIMNLRNIICADN